MHRFGMQRLILVLGAAVIALGLPRVSPACFMRSPQPVQVWLDHIHVEITNGIAVKTYNCTFKNLNAQAIVGGECYMELEPGAQVDDMSVWVDGKEMKAEILDVAKAKEVFADIVQKGGSPALLEYFGNQLITTKVPKVPANGTVQVKLRYTMALKKRDGLVRLQMLNTNPKTLLQPLESAGVTVKIKEADPLKNIYSPTHDIKIEEEKEWDVVVKWEEKNYLPRHPFVLYYDTNPQAVGASLITHRDFDEEGTFMMMLSPTVGTGPGQISSEAILPKDVVFCVDTSGSMLQGNKMQQARNALKYCVEQLRDGDRFNIVNFSTSVRSFQEQGLVEVDDATRKRALEYVRKLSPRGGTAIQEALDHSLKMLANDKDRLKMILFATDGLPTIGETDPQAILKNMAKRNTDDVRVFAFGEGFDVNTKLLDFLALNNRGEAEYILPEEDIAEKISRFFDRVGSPILTDLQVEFDGLEAKDVFPKQIKDVFRGEQVILYGRYTGHGRKTVRVTGKSNGKTETFTFELEFPEFSEDDQGSFAPRLWAGRKVDYLLTEIRKAETPPQELVDEVSFLAKRYGIVTPYTSYLMTDDVVAETPTAPGFGGAIGGPIPPGQPRPVPLNVRLKRNLSDALETAPAASSTVEEKRARVDAAKKLSNSRQALDRSGGASALDEAAEAEFQSGGRKESGLTQMRYIGTQTFYQSRGAWYQSDFDAKKAKDIKTIEVGSKEYVDLLLKKEGLAKFLALGEVVVKIDGEWVRFVEPPKE
ncbi:VIT and vWA domain-containing protein [Thalassoroseus pseudoceratinae]|uniref:VIT and vWA domain-containing protein n=1 Tax=Thalassoroseus pseudoceratinae TaxID=2713176 RepID=UPI00141FAEE6|nr:VIT and VWA domain-containing protein [Thalassoroseus pseudoceratinae]